MKIVLDSSTVANSLQSFLHSDSAIAKALRALSLSQCKIYVFGGCLRDIVIHNSAGRGIRDIDIVVDSNDFSDFCEIFSSFTIGRNAFGGLKLEIGSVPIDAWSLQSTWALEGNFFATKSYQNLPNTVFLNIDGIVAELTPLCFEKTGIYAKPFIDAFKTKTLDIVFQYNPNPILVVNKAIEAMVRYDMSLSHSLARYIAATLRSVQTVEVEAAQERRYKRPIFSSDTFAHFSKELFKYVDSDNAAKHAFRSVTSRPSQMEFQLAGNVKR